MRSRSTDAPRATVVLAVALAAGAFGCKKSVDPLAFDAGAGQPVAVAAVPSTPEVADAAVAPLAPLAASAAPVVKKVAPKASAAASASAKGPNPDDLQECTNARAFCNSPKVTTDARTKRLCDTFKAECVAKGGKV